MLSRPKGALLRGAPLKDQRRSIVREDGEAG